MLDKTVVAAVAGVIGLMVVVTFLGQGSRKQSAIAPPASSLPVPASKPLSDAELLHKYDQMPSASRYKFLTHDGRASALYLHRMSVRVRGSYDKLTPEEKYFADSMTYGHGQVSVQTEGKRAQEKAVKAAK